MHFLAIGILLLALTSCSKVDLETPEPNAVLPGTKAILTALKRHSDKTAGIFLQETRSLVKNIEQFVSNPNQATQTNMQRQWQTAHVAFTYANFGLFTASDSQSYRIDAWPIQPGFIDNLEHYPTSGIVYDETLDLNDETLVWQHGVTDSGEVVLGLHSLELLIFTRPASDYIADADQWTNRRRELLLLVAAQFREDAQDIVAANQVDSDEDANEVLEQFLLQALLKVRVAFRESNLVAAQETGHCLTRDRSLLILLAEVNALEDFLVTEVPISQALKARVPGTYDNFRVTLEEAKETIQKSGDDEVAMATLPLLLSALTHQIEAFHQSLGSS